MSNGDKFRKLLHSDGVLGNSNNRFSSGVGERCHRLRIGVKKVIWPSGQGGCL